MAKRGGVSINRKKYDRFRGVDFSTDPALVDDARSPWAPNMVSDMGGMPEKRPGWRVLHQLEGRINGLYRGTFDDGEHLLVHVGKSLYRWYEEETEPKWLASNLPDERSMAVYLDGSLWIFTGETLLRYDGDSLRHPENHAYVPLTIISRAPKGNGGVSYEAVNLLQKKQRVRFCGDGETYIYQLPYDTIDNAAVTVRTNMEGNGWEVMQDGFSVSPETGTVSFEYAPAKPLVGEEDNVEIEFSKTIPGYADRIGKCRTAIVWGVGGSSDRIVATGNPDYPNQDFICGFNDGTYWPDTGYQVVGTEETAIVGYRRLGEYLAISRKTTGRTLQCLFAAVL